jgi:hypothetical protein
MYVCMYVWVDRCMYVCMYVCMYEWIDVCMYVCMGERIKLKYQKLRNKIKLNQIITDYQFKLSHTFTTSLSKFQRCL